MSDPDGPSEAGGIPPGGPDDPGGGAPGAGEVRFLRAALEVSRVSRDFLAWMERAGEQLAPARTAALGDEAARDLAPAIARVRAELDAAPPPDELLQYARLLGGGLEHVERACRLFVGHRDASPAERIPMILEALHEAARAQERFYHLRRVAPPFAGFWNIDGAEDPEEPLARRDGEAGPPTGVVHVRSGGRHGGFSLYVPETYTADREWPLIVALHGGSGNGADFLWTWVREAKSRGYVLIAPSAIGSTWDAPDNLALLEILEMLRGRYRIADRRILLTGLSDGGTFTLLFGLANPDVYRALAPLCGVLHPANGPLGNLQRARGVPIYLVHGALDFLFPVAVARIARDELERAGAALVYRELPELSHTYPRSENVRILDWFEALPG